jgi:hypothetical protein
VKKHAPTLASPAHCHTQNPLDSQCYLTSAALASMPACPYITTRRRRNNPSGHLGGLILPGRQPVGISGHRSTPRQETWLQHNCSLASRTTIGEGQNSQASPQSGPPTNSGGAGHSSAHYRGSTNTGPSQTFVSLDYLGWRQDLQRGARLWPALTHYLRHAGRGASLTLSH